MRTCNVQKYSNIVFAILYTYPINLEEFRVIILTEGGIFLEKRVLKYSDDLVLSILMGQP